MLNREEIFSQAFRNKKDLLTREKAEFDAAMSRFREENPEYVKIERKLASLGAQIAVTALSDDKSGLELLQREIAELSNEKGKFNCPKMQYTCEKCRDTGYIGGKICGCIKDAAKKITVGRLCDELPLESCRFENFDLNYYPADDGSGGSPKKRMTQILKLCKEFVIDFSPKSEKNLLFMGSSGLGKTHLSLAMVSVLAERGFNVIYGSAYNLFSQMETEQFSLRSHESFNAAVECDLLVIDDLGGEFVSPYIQALLYNIINMRLLAERPTVISTNLSMSEIEDRYTPRVSSRLLGHYTAKKFAGKDIRQLKALEKTSK